MQTPEQKFSLLTKLPCPPGPVPDVPSGCVRLFKESNWTSAKPDIDITNFPEKSRNRVDKNIFDEATWIAFNLEVGHVATFMDNPATLKDQGLFADLSGAGATVDLVGNGSTVGVDLKQLGLNDKISMFFWRKVDMSMGAFELFEQDSFNGNRVTIFLSEWEPNTVYDLAQWFIQDKTTSIRFPSLDREIVSLFDKSNASDNGFNNVAGVNKVKEYARLQNQDWNDKISAFRWRGLIPVYSEIAPFQIGPEEQGKSELFSATADTYNEGDVETVMTAKWSKQTAVTCTSSTTEEFVSELTTEMSTEESATVGPVTAKTNIKVVAKMSYKNSKTQSTTCTHSETLGEDRQVRVPARSMQSSSLTAQIYNIKDRTYETRADRWYDQQVAGSVQDNRDGQTLFKRTETVRIRISGGVASKTAFHTGKTIPLDRVVQP